MTLNGAIMQLVELSEHPMMPVIFKPLIQKVIETISELEENPESHWIPVTERLPEESGQYLITVKYEHVDGYEDIYAEHGEWSDGKWDMFGFGHCGKVEDIVAWMPLPEPYKEVTECANI